MRDRVSYEWDVELYENYAPRIGGGDVVDHDFRDKLSDIVAGFERHGYTPDSEGREPDSLMEYRVVLVKSYGNEFDGVTDRFWSYITEDGLPETFEDGRPVPVRLRREWDRHGEEILKGLFPRPTH